MLVVYRTIAVHLELFTLIRGCLKRVSASHLEHNRSENLSAFDLD